MLRQVVEQRLALMLDFEKINQGLLLIGDWYTAKLYRIIYDEFYLDEWAGAIKGKLDNLESIIQVIQDNFSFSWSTFLEMVQIAGWLVLLLWAISCCSTLIFRRDEVMLKTLLGLSEFIFPSLIILAILIVGVTLLAPTDKVLGEATRMVYVHGAIIRVVLGTFLLSGVLGLIYLFSKKPALYDWSRIVQETSLLLWIPYLLSALIATLQTWGAIAWFEPRWLVTLQISVIAPVAYRRLVDREETDRSRRP